MFEPEYSADEVELEISSSDDEQKEIAAMTEPEQRRLTDLFWCLCGNCTLMPTSHECHCCREFDPINEKMEDGNSNCITNTERFRWTCLDGEILKIALMNVHDSLSKGPLPVFAGGCTSFKFASQISIMGFRFHGKRKKAMSGLSLTRLSQLGAQQLGILTIFQH